MQPTKLQEAILKAFNETDDNLVVLARAGAGKTSTLKMLADAVPSHKGALFMAFNKAIASELEKKMPSRVKCATCHSVGFSEIRQRIRTQVDSRKVSNIIKGNYSLDWENASLYRNIVSAAKSVGFGTNACEYEYDVAAMNEFIEDFFATQDVIIPESFNRDLAPDIAFSILRMSNDDMSLVDFDDMIYLPIFMNWHFTQYPYLFVDEAQDLSPLQHAMVLKLGKRTVCVGDDRQAIYAFRGADSDSIENLTRALSATVLPLNMSFRCPQSVTRLAQDFVSDLECLPDAPEGEIRKITHAEFLEQYEPRLNDMILCRNNRPLFSMALHFLKERIPFRISSNFNETLVKRVKSFKASSIQQLKVRCKAWADTEIHDAERKRQRGRISRIMEIEGVILDFADECLANNKSEAKDVIALIEKITMSSNGVNLTTIHKAKGLEAARVFFLRPELLPSEYCTSNAQMKQEYNLIYVGVTRAMKELIFISDSFTHWDVEGDA